MKLREAKRLTQDHLAGIWQMPVIEVSRPLEQVPLPTSTPQAGPGPHLLMVLDLVVQHCSARRPGNGPRQAQAAG